VLHIVGELAVQETGGVFAGGSDQAQAGERRS
jgi:hypothetical protein